MRESCERVRTTRAAADDDWRPTGRIADGGAKGDAGTELKSDGLQRRRLDHITYGKAIEPKGERKILA